jgi:hypothetical protein
MRNKLTVEFEVLTAVVILWNIKLHAACWFLLGLFLDPEDGSYMFLQNVG